MTFDRDRHTPFEELISASLPGDLTADERRRLDEHLDTCATCRATLAAFSDQRRIMSGLRHVPVPRDLGARVRTGIEVRDSARRWWQRPPVIFAGVGGGLAVVAGALLALVLLNGPTEEPNVGQVSPTPTGSAPSVSSTPIPTLPPIVTPAPSQPAATVAPSVSAQPAPTATPIQASPEPDSYLAVTGPPDNQAMTLRDGTTGETLREVETPPGVPIAAELSPDGAWLAYIAQVGTGSGQTEVRATRVADGETVALGTSVDGSPFVEHLFWSPDGRYLAFTLVDPDAASTDAWIFDVATEVTSRLTDVGNAYAGSWVPGDGDGALLWLSTADEEPRSYLRLFHEDEGQIATIDPQDGPYPAATNVFQPIVSPNGGYVIYWTGRMDHSGNEYEFVAGGAPWLALNLPDGARGFDFADSRPVFTDVTIDRDAFSSAAIQWSLNGDAFAVWDAAWTGIPQGSEAEEYPDPTRVYLGRTSDGRHVTRIHALDAGDLPADATVVDVKVAGTGRHLAVTARHPVAGLDLPQADLLLVTRNFENVADEVLDLEPDKEGWFGPAVFNAAEWAELIGD